MAGFGQAPFARSGKSLSMSGSPSLSPASAWDGTPGSGFSSTPTDPARTTAKPAIRLLDLPNQFFDNRLTLSVIALANDGGTLIGGIDRVRFHFEGNVQDVVAPALRTFSRYDGSLYVLPCYSVQLKKPTGVEGAARLFVEAFPADATMQRRVIGPILFYPHEVFPATGTLHDIELTVDPDLPTSAGSNYQSFTAAHSYLQTQHAAGTTYRNPRITIKKPSPTGFWDITRGHFASYAPQGWLTVNADVPVIFGKPGPFDDLINMHTGNGTNGIGARPNLDAVLLQGSNITLEMSNMVIYPETASQGRGWAFDRVRIQNLAGIEKSVVKRYRQEGVCGPGGAYYTDCLIEDIPSLFNGTPLARGNITRGTWFDYGSDSFALVANMATDHSSAEWNVETPGLTVQYTGAGTGTISLSGNRDENNRVLTAKVNGASVGAMTLVRPGSTIDPARNEEVSDVVGFFNGLSGWTATLDGNDRRAVMLGLAGGPLHGFGDTDAKTAPLVLTCRADLHGDFYQVSNGAVSENAIIYGNVVTGFAGQKLFFSVPTQPVRDLYAVNNAIGDKFDGTGSEDPGVLYSQLGRQAHSNVVIAHNSMTQFMSLRTDDGAYNPDGYCLIANNSFGGLAYAGNGAPDPDIVIRGNHTFAGTSGPSGATAHSTGGDETTLFANIEAGDFAPAGALLANAKTPIIAFAISGSARASPEPAGAGPVAAIDFASLPPPREPSALAPTITSASIAGTPEDGEVLTASWTGSGYPVPTASYQWQRNGADLAGKSSPTLTLDATAMGLSDGDEISCEITLSNVAGTALAEPAVAFAASGLGPSLYTTANMVKEFEAANSDLIDADSFRSCRSGSANGRFAIYNVPPGSYRIRGTKSAYDGAVSGIGPFRLQVIDNFSVRHDTFATGAIDVTVSITSGLLRFYAATAGYGFRIDDFHIESA